MAKMTIMVGLPGSGKSTFAAKNASKNTVIVSSDTIRKELYGDEAIQGNPKDVFERFYGQIEYALLNNKNVVCDATNVSKFARKQCIDIGKKYQCHIQCLYIVKDVSTCVRQQQKRDRQVPISVICRMAETLKKEPPSTDEGFETIQYI